MVAMTAKNFFLKRGAFCADIVHVLPQNMVFADATCNLVVVRRLGLSHLHNFLNYFLRSRVIL